MKWLFNVMLLLVALNCAGQATMFKVENEKNVVYDDKEAIRIYAEAVDCVRNEYHIVDALAPTFVLILGAEPPGKILLRLPGKDLQSEIRLQKWDPRSFRRGVIMVAINQLLLPNNVDRLARRLEAKIDVNELRKER